ncbi:MAG: MoxR family ATPase [Herpetosiphon sp.]
MIEQHGTETESLTSFAETVRTNIERVIIGKQKLVDVMLAALLAGGHVLLEDVPGTGKTTLARALAISLGVEFRRIQCTPDLLPNDIAGVSVYHQPSGEFRFRPGPLFTNILLADEINRATPRTQAALLEAMAERQVTVDGITYPLPAPFFVLATQNPVEYEGTFPLPEAQLDRFLMQLPVGYPQLDEERRMLRASRTIHPIDLLGSVVESEALPRLQRQLDDIFMGDEVLDYLLRLAVATRQHPDLTLGASPRATLGLFRSSQAMAALQHRDFVLPDDVKALAAPVLAHRLMIRPESALRGRTAATVLQEILATVSVEADRGSHSDGRASS